MTKPENSGAHNDTQSPNPAAPNSARPLLAHTPDIDRLRSALASTPPGDDLWVIAYHYLAPMVKAATEFPEVEESMKELACLWSCGELHDGKYPGLTGIKRSGLSGKALFLGLWKHFVQDTAYTGPRRSLGSIYHVAKKAGWTPI